MAEEIAIRDGVITEILKDIFVTMVSLPITQATGEIPAPETISGVTAIITIAMQEKQVILGLHGSEKLACAVYGAMLGEQAAEWSDDVGDAFGELANMTAGNIKATFAGTGHTLSIPMVVRGNNYKWQTPGVRELRVEHFLVNGELLTLRIGEKIE